MPKTVEQLLEEKKVRESTGQAPPQEDRDARKKRLLSKVRVLRENLASGTVVEGEPDKCYCWVNIREERQIFFQAMGWTLVKDLEGKVKSGYRQLDGTHKRADLILYEIDREMYEAIDAEKELRRIEAMEGAELSFQTSAAQNGAPTFRPRV